LTAGHARALLALDDPAAQRRLADDIVKKSLTVRQAEELASTGGPKKKAGSNTRAGGRHSQLDEIAELLGDRLNTRVAISLSKKKGQITIDFATVADLNRILGEMGVDGYGQR